MLAARKDAVCLNCGTTAGLERHEPAGRQNNKTVRVWLCRSCHAAFTAAQERLGFPLSREREHTHGDQSWSLLLGFCVQLEQVLRGICECNGETAALFRRVGLACAYLVDVIAPDEHRPARGPDPLGNDLHATFVERGFGRERPTMHAIGEQPIEVERRQVAAVLEMASEVEEALATLVPGFAEFGVSVGEVFGDDFFDRFYALPPGDRERLVALGQGLLQRSLPAFDALLNVDSPEHLPALLKSFPMPVAVTETEIATLAAVGDFSFLRGSRSENDDR